MENLVLVTWVKELQGMLMNKFRGPSQWFHGEQFWLVQVTVPHTRVGPIHLEEGREL